MKRLSTLLAAMFMAGSASAATLDFSGPICGGPCGNGSFIDQTYGDIGGEVDVIYDADRATAALDDVQHWGAGYETLANVAYGELGGGGMSILFDAAAGFSVSVLSFDIAPYANRLRDTLVRVIDRADDSVLFEQFFTPLSTAGVTSFASTWMSDVGIEIQLGPDAWDVGISNIEYTTAVTGPAPVPLPAGAWLMLAGLAGFGVLRRRN